jgi:nucleoside recognition membrane protein YjiH
LLLAVVLAEVSLKLYARRRLKWPFYVMIAASGIYIAAVASSLIRRWWPSAQMPVFLGAALCYIAVAVTATHRTIYTTRLGLYVTLLAIPGLLIALTAIFALGALVGHFDRVGGIEVDVMLTTLLVTVSAAGIRELILARRPPKKRHTWIEP